MIPSHGDARLSAYLDECSSKGPLVIMRNGKAIAILLVPFDEEDLERLVLERSPCFRALLSGSRTSKTDGKVLSEGAFWKAVRKRSLERKSGAAKTARSRR